MQKYRPQSFPLKLKLLRLKAGKSQEEVSALLCISRSCLANYETGKRQPDAEMLVKIANLFKVTEAYLLSTPLYQDAPLHEADTVQTDSPRTLLKSHGDSLDISHLPIEHQIGLLGFYNYVLNTERQMAQIQGAYEGPCKP
ncbi:MAG: helix-turn-helix transcriptional regulator [Clostridia bacterium]|nr:helix-turn-helix transcriptional regulator [Clostridia bacterium]